MEKKFETKEYNFTVKNTHGEPYITIQPMAGEISVFESAILSFNLRDGVTKEEAWEVAKKLNDVVESINYQEI